MRTRFADTYYFLALVNRKDAGHTAARSAASDCATRLLTTAWVLVEFGDAMAAVQSRSQASQFLRGLLTRTDVKVLHPSWDEFERALRLYESRADQDWSLTDCISFTIMREYGITEALIADHHFEQAGFIAVLRTTDQ